jgi:hypothetical protein
MALAACRNSRSRCENAASFGSISVSPRRLARRRARSRRRAGPIGLWMRFGVCDDFVGGAILALCRLAFMRARVISCRVSPSHLEFSSCSKLRLQ